MKRWLLRIKASSAGRKLQKVKRHCRKYPKILQKTQRVFEEHPHLSGILLPTKYEQRWLRATRRAAASCVGMAVRIRSSRAGEFWRPPRSEDDLGKVAEIVDFEWNVLAYHEGFSGASFWLRMPDGKQKTALIEEIELAEKAAEAQWH